MNTEQRDPQSGEQAVQNEQNQPESATYEAEGAETAEAGTAEASEPQDAVQAELEQAKKLADENHQRFLRAQADFDNYRRRTQKEKEDFAKYASLKVIEQLLPVIDNFDRALAASKDNKDYDALAKGIDMTFRQLTQILATEGLTAMETVGTPFNPEYHQAIMQVESDEYEEGIVVEEVQKGYMLKDKVLRPAMVKVSS
ncbi:nucleotide exchange factor GrpE [Paenibacillus validus]|uniref:Protein GrpE n=1 Tax=Paenibacillus validus TaxID=44253 RepID=A0A7X2Z8B6_9BACL|nr:MULTISPECIES: nucleotide exchange factor GrpE [Paenibacillus]MED4603651.1 nucleotide exchange factor GrpE [Paenibacillus validus]MED4608430.1 nucleotide exchange factor GrpE [Paenibacillus validus]MUG69548.1 nucleotide exchange factor GrpE [Paenibacillus validus]